MLISQRCLSAAAVICTARLALLSAAYGAEPALATNPPSVVIVVRIQLHAVTNEKLIEAERSWNAEVTTAIEKELAKISPNVERASVSTCADRSCLPDLATRRGVDQAVVLTGVPNEDDGYDFQAVSWSRGAFRTLTDRCEFCGGDRLVQLASKMVRGLVVAEIAPSPPAPLDTATATSAATRAPASALVVPAPPPSPAAPPSLLAPTVIGAAGVALLAGGVSLWVVSGHSSENCQAPVADTPDCDVYKTRRLGQIVTGIGAAGLVAAGVLFYRVLDETRSVHVSIGPGGVAMEGRF